MEKKWWHSKTLWVNVLAILAMIAEYLLTNQIYSPELHAIVIALINFALRFVTNSNLTK